MTSVEHEEPEYRAEANSQRELVHVAPGHPFRIIDKRSRQHRDEVHHARDQAGEEAEALEAPPGSSRWRCDTRRRLISTPPRIAGRVGPAHDCNTLGRALIPAPSGVSRPGLLPQAASCRRASASAWPPACQAIGVPNPLPRIQDVLHGSSIAPHTRGLSLVVVGGCFDASDCRYAL